MLLLLPRMLDCRGRSSTGTTTRPTHWPGARAGTPPSSGPGAWVRRKQQHHACRCEPDPERQDGTSYSAHARDRATAWPREPALSTQALPLPRPSAPRQGRVLNADPRPPPSRRLSGQGTPGRGLSQQGPAAAERERVQSLIFLDALIHLINS